MVCTSIKTAARPKHHNVAEGIGDIQSTSRGARTKHELAINSSDFPIVLDGKVAEASPNEDQTCNLLMCILTGQKQPWAKDVVMQLSDLSAALSHDHLAG
jgi:hypothetical protein